jgi:uncharacterized repeat protein (TIGR02543 family)
MKKLFLGFLLVVTAFLGANQLNINLYAETTAGVTFVDHQDNGELWVYYNGNPYFESSTNINIDIPENAISVRVYNGNLDEDIEPTIYQQFSTSYTLNLVWSTDQFILDEMEGSVISWDFVHDNEPIAVIFQIETPEPAELPYWNFADGYFILDYNAVGEELDVEVLVDVYPNPTFYNAVNDVLIIATVNNQIRVKYTQIDDMMGTPIYGYQVYSGSEWLTLSELKYQVDNLEPIITGSTLIVSLENPLPESALRDEITALDDVDGDITYLLTYEGGTYEPARLADTLVPGTQYTILYSVEDSSGNVAEATILVEVYDITAPTFGITNTTVEVSYDEEFNIDQFKSSLLATDNYTILVTITVVADTYSANMTTLGDFIVTYEAEDEFGNTSTITIDVVVVDEVPPVVTGSFSFDTPVNRKTDLSLFLQQVIATDEKEGDVTSSIQVIEDNYTAATSVGSYTVLLRYSDLSGNTVDQVITITLKDNMPPILFVTENLLIAIDELDTLTLEQIISIITQSGNLTGYTVLANTYTGNENTQGTYLVTIQGTDTEGATVMYSTSIFVTSAELSTWIVSFMTNGGSVLSEVIVNDFGQVLVTTPVREGYRFVGWYKDAELTQPFSIVTDRITADTILYAKWTPLSATGGSIIVDNIANFTVTDWLISVSVMFAVLGLGFYLAKKKRG